jgi:AcrR family transcriptional regulator
MGRKSLAKERRAQIIEAFYRCVIRDGLQNASTRQIAQEAGVQPSILHHYFKDRAEMIEELVKSIVDQNTERYLAEINRYKDPAKRINKALAFLFGPDMINDEQSALFYDLWAEAKRNERVRESFSMLYRRFRDAIVNLLIETNTAAGLSPAEIKELANMVIALQDGVSLQWDMDPSNVSLKKASCLTKDLIELYVKDKNKKPESRITRISNEWHE